MVQGFKVVSGGSPSFSLKFSRVGLCVRVWGRFWPLGLRLGGLMEFRFLGAGRAGIRGLGSKEKSKDSVC